MHLPGAQALKPVHPATKTGTPGAGCTLNFEHCNIISVAICLRHKSHRLTRLIGFVILYLQYIILLRTTKP